LCCVHLLLWVFVFSRGVDGEQQQAFCVYCIMLMCCNPTNSTV
jgi:hypothetical protein